VKAAKRRKCPLCGKAVKGVPTTRSGMAYSLRGSELDNVTSVKQLRDALQLSRRLPVGGLRGGPARAAEEALAGAAPDDALAHDRAADATNDDVRFLLDYDGIGRDAADPADDDSLHALESRTWVLRHSR
jgi:hypothetical protein